MLCGQVMPTNPAAAVRRPGHVVKTGRTPVLEHAQEMAAHESPRTKKLYDRTTFDARRSAAISAYWMERQGQGFHRRTERSDGLIPLIVNKPLDLVLQLQPAKAARE